MPRVTPQSLHGQREEERDRNDEGDGDRDDVRAFQAEGAAAYDVFACGNAHALGRVYERICEIVARAKKGVVKILPSVL